MEHQAHANLQTTRLRRIANRSARAARSHASRVAIPLTEHRTPRKRTRVPFFSPPLVVHGSAAAVGGVHGPALSERLIYSSTESALIVLLPPL